MSKTKEVKEILGNAKKFIETVGWTQGAIAKNSLGQRLTHSVYADNKPEWRIFGEGEDNAPTCYCMLGAITEAFPFINTNNGNALRHHLYLKVSRAAMNYDFDLDDHYHSDEEIIAAFNDSKNTTKEKVLACLDDAIKACEM